MISYSLSELGREAGKRKGTQATLPEIVPSLAAERDYYRALRAMLDAMAKIVRESIIPAYSAQKKHDALLDGALINDVDESWFSVLSGEITALTAITALRMRQILRRESSRHTNKFILSIKSIIGIDLSAIVRDEDLEPYLRTATAMNVALIRNLAEDALKRIETSVYTNAIAGNSVRTLQKDLQKQFGISQSRAKLIARDQIGKLDGQLTRIRQEQAGVASYRWRTAHDERVRARHRELEGKQYKWGEATGAEGGAQPGEPVQCFSGDNRFFANHGVNGLIRTVYAGKTAKIISNDGSIVNATPNHPILTPGGWKPAHLINRGDYIVQASNTGIFAPDVDIEQRHATFVDTFYSIRAGGYRSRNGMRGDLYGDYIVGNDIDIVGPASDLLTDADSDFLKGIGYLILTETFSRLGGLMRDGVNFLSLNAMSHSPNRAVGVLRELASFFLAQSGHSDGVGARAVPDIYATALQFINDSRSAAPIALRERKNAISGAVLGNHGISVELSRIVRLSIEAFNHYTVTTEYAPADGVASVAKFGADIVHGNSIEEHVFSKVNDVIWDSFHGYVYTSDTEYGWYTVNGFVARNCRCWAEGIVVF